MKLLKQTLLAATAALGIWSCNPTDTPTANAPFSSGVLVLNEGNFMDNNGSVTYLPRSGAASYDIYRTANGRALGSGLSGYGEAGSKGILLADNASPGKDSVKIVEAGTFKQLAAIGGIENPRTVVGVSETKAYLICWDAFNPDYSFKPAYLAVLNLTTNQITKKITLPPAAQSAVLVGSEVFIGSDGASDKNITVIDVATDAVKQKIEVGSNPNVLGTDAAGRLWVATGREFVKINTAAKNLDSRVAVKSDNAKKTIGAATLSSDKKTIYFMHTYYDANWNARGELYNFPTTSTSITANAPLAAKTFSGLGFDAKDNYLYAGLVPSYKQAGYVFRYRPDGKLVDSVKAEIAPVRFFFK